jgi:hypothetical protein
MLFQRLGAVDGLAVDVCEKGASVLCSESILIDEKCMVALDLNVSARKRRINAWGKVTHVAHEAGGRTTARIRFVDMDAGCRIAIRAWQLHD